MWFFIGGIFHCIKAVVTKVDPLSGLPGGKRQCDTKDAKRPLEPAIPKKGALNTIIKYPFVIVLLTGLMIEFYLFPHLFDLLHFAIILSPICCPNDASSGSSFEI